MWCQQSNVGPLQEQMFLTLGATSLAIVDVFVFTAYVYYLWRYQRCPEEGINPLDLGSYLT